MLHDDALSVEHKMFFFCFFVSGGLNPLYYGIPTTVTDHSSSLIDHVFSNIRNECCHVGMFDAVGLDHRVVLFYYQRMSVVH